MSIDRKLVLVTGAAGWIGRLVCSALQQQGCIVAAFDQVAAQGPWNEAFVGGLNCLRNPPADLLCLLGKTKAVVHCAGRAHRPVETAEEVAAFEEVNVGGTRDLAAACKSTGISRIVYVSTIAGYDWAVAPASGVSETDQIRPTTAYASTKLEGERIVRESGLDWRVVRLATVFGTGDRANFAKLARGLKTQRFVVPGRGSACKSVIPTELAADVLARLALLEEPKHRLLNVALSHAPSLREICDAFSINCGFSRARSIPISVLQGGAIIGNAISMIQPGFPLTTTNVKKLTTTTVVDNTRMREIFPDILLQKFDVALRASADFYRDI